MRDRSAAAFSKLVREHPLSAYADAAKKRLTAMEQPIPDPDPVALARQKYEIANRTKPGMMSHFWGVFRKSPDMSQTAKSGAPAMESFRPTVPVTVPVTAPAAAAGADVSASTITGQSALDTQPDARPGAQPGAQAQPAAQAPAAQDSTQPAAQSSQPASQDNSAATGKKTKKPKKTKNPQ